MERTMQYTELDPNDMKGDLIAKRKALQDIQLDPHIYKDPELKAELARCKAALEKEAKDKGVE